MGRARIELGEYGSPSVSARKNHTGQYRAWITVREWNGKTRMLTAHATTMGRARNQILIRAEEWAKSNKVLGSDPTIDQLLKTWLNSRSTTESAVDGEISQQTRASYEYYANKYIVPEVGQIRAKELRASHAKRFLLGLITPEGGHTTARLCRTILKQAFDYAVGDDVIGANPVTSVILPTKRKSRPRALRDDELLTLRKAIHSWRREPGLSGPPRSEHLSDVFEVMLGTGLRIGEVLALCWKDIDLIDGLVTVHATLVEERGMRDEHGAMQMGRFFYQDRRKLGAPDYSIQLPEWVHTLLIARRINAPALNPIDAVFVSREGT
ncbi:hypothetical protein DXT87_12255 [Arthrobacter sp. AET 35A]|nr:hypothetical protein [Arthrobacter sp. AET 35A]